jgi:mannose-6-phosphate isomerase-like protein (cupin superfamily)
MQQFEIEQLCAARRQSRELYLEFLRVPALRCGLYELAAGADDPQKPHNEDEVYYVVGGRGMFWCEGSERSIEPGSLLYVPARAVHRFHTIREDLTVLVFFAPGGG